MGFLSHSEEATGLFNDSVDAIISGFEEQQKFATTPITVGFKYLLGVNSCVYSHFQVAFLVGGLSTNDWLWYRLQSYFKEKNINICRPDNHMCVLG